MFRPGECTWQEGGKFIPGTVNDVGGSSTAEFGHLLATLYPEPGFTTAELHGDLREASRSAANTSRTESADAAAQCCPAGIGGSTQSAASMV